MQIRLIKSLLIILLFGYSFLTSQSVIKINDGSFEELELGQGILDWNYQTWTDCHGKNFKESPPDVHGLNTLIWKNDVPPSDGKKYLGLVTRDNHTFEAVGQRLQQSLLPDQFYQFNFDLASSANYLSSSRMSFKEANYNNKTILKIYIGNEMCDKAQLIYQSKPISNHQWESITVVFSPLQESQFIIFEAFYPTRVKEFTCGNILIDKISHINKLNNSAPLTMDSIINKQKLDSVKFDSVKVFLSQNDVILVANDYTPYLNSYLFLKGLKTSIEKVGNYTAISSLSDDKIKILKEITTVQKDSPGGKMLEKILVLKKNLKDYRHDEDFADDLEQINTDDQLIDLVKKWADQYVELNFEYFMDEIKDIQQHK